MNRSDQHLETETHAFLYLLECTMATLDSLQMKKSSSKSEIARHKSIIEFGLSAVERFSTAILFAPGHTRYGRVQEAIEVRRKGKI